jgi:small-conductance mechanosensitive channel
MVSFFDPAYWVALYHSGKLGDLVLSILMRGVVIALILLGARLLAGTLQRMIGRALSALAERSGARGGRLSTLHSLLTSAVSYLVFFCAIILVLFTLGLTWTTLTPLLGAASVLGLAIGFGAQKLVRDVITGLFILGEGQFDVGEWVTIGSVTGQVEEIGLRVTRLRDEQGRLYSVANGDITQVFNASRGQVRATLDITLLRAQPIDELMLLLFTLMGEVQETLDVHPEPGQEPTIALVGMEAAKVTLRVTFWAPVRTHQQIEDAFRRRVLTLHEKANLALA